ncbi:MULTISPECIES: dermonecrotic toxin domain-containing protein [Pseudomonas]|uniref:dermonecrotic toxin domain-containing protein n=1 Tax=Pseudomonas TaxID=286 RepID=UPI001C614153|nr:MULTISPECIES: DUF6543 domain-containing protein [Pseudomonas]
MSSPPFSLSPPDGADSDAAVEAASQFIRDQLTRRVNTCAHPSRLINQIGLAERRCRESTQALSRLIGRSPKVLTVIRAELRKAFEVDPDRLLFTETKAPGVVHKVDSLTERALLLLVLPSVSINVNQFTVLSIEGEPQRRLPYTPLQVLRRVIAMRLFERLAHAVSDYWDTPAQGSWRTRRERWVDLYTQLFADQAFMARQLDELSSAGIAMVKALIDAPTAEARQRAGGDWASVRVAQLMWPGTSAVAIPGALHLYREGDPVDAPHVIHLPGAARNFYEYRSFASLQCGLLELESSRLHDLWQCLPLNRRNGLCRPADLSAASTVMRGLEVMSNALELGAQALLTGQSSNELACAVSVNHAHVFSSDRPRPPPLDAVRLLAYAEGFRKQMVGSARLGALGDQLLDWDHRRRRAEIIFASTTSGLALRTVQERAKRYEQRVLALLDPSDPGADTPTYQALTTLVEQLKAHTQALDTLMKGARARLLELGFWAERPGGAWTARRVTLFMNAQTEALRCEVHLQHQLKLLSTAHRDLVIDVVEQPWAYKRTDSDAQVYWIAVGSEPDAFYALHNVWVVTTAPAMRVPTRQHPVVLYAFGMDGGVVAFSGVEALTRSLKASLGSRDDSPLWGYIERDKRRDLRAHATNRTLAVRYLNIKGKPALAALKKLLGSYDRLQTSHEELVRLFSEVKDAELSRALLTVELEQQLKIPANVALSQAQAAIELVRKAASEAKTMPAWLTRATRGQRKRFRRSLKLYLSGTFAFRTGLEHELPDLYTFARRVLTARLREDGISPELDIDQPFIELPDDVQGSFCGWTSGCTAGDRNIQLTPTVTRTSFSLLQLAMHNLDPLAPWTRWRLNRARFLQPEWKQSLNADYLIRMVSSLDIGGQYDASILRVFYPRVAGSQAPGAGRVPALLNRALRTGYEHHLLSAIQRGLTAAAQSVFSTAMAARTPQDLLKNQHELQLYVVHLIGHTMLHDRYIAGIVVVQDKRTGLCVVYWPEAAHDLVLTEYGSLQHAHDELNRLGASPANVKALARQVAPGWAFEAVVHHPDGADQSGPTLDYLDLIPAFVMAKGIWQGIEFIRSFGTRHLEPVPFLDEIEKQALEQIASDPLDWLALVATSHSDAQALLYRASVLELQRTTQAASQSGKALQAYRTRRLGEQSDTRDRAVKAFFSPLFGMFNDFYELLLAARRFHRFGDARDALDVGFMSTVLAIDLLLNFVPGPKKVGGSAARAIRPRSRTALARMRRLPVTTSGGARVVPSPVTQLDALARFKTKGLPDEAVALKAPGEHGIYVKNGESFVADGVHHYPVYRRSDEPMYRLKNQHAPGQDELILNIRHSREWLLDADAPQPAPGSSAGALSPWRAPVSPAPDWRPPVVRAATENRIRQSPAPTTYWCDWKVQLSTTQLSATSSMGTFHVHMEPPNFPFDVIYVGRTYDSPTTAGAGYYRLLHQGANAPLDGIAFITRNEPLVSRAHVDIDRWTTTALAEQPIPVSRSATGEWRLHSVQFDRPLANYVGIAFPEMTSQSRVFTAQRLIELADSSRPATATHLLNIRATLDNWLTPTANGLGQTDDLLRLLRPTERQDTINIGYEGKAPGFTRVDFNVSGLAPALRDRARGRGLGRGRAAQRSAAQSARIERVLQQQGFNVQRLQVLRGRRTVDELIATHPLSSSNRVYYISPHWLERSGIPLNTRLTDSWVNVAIKKNPNSLLLAGVESAMRENRLVRIVAGVQWPTLGTLAPTVYFVKVNPS